MVSLADPPCQDSKPALSIQPNASRSRERCWRWLMCHYPLDIRRRRRSHCGRARPLKNALYSQEQLPAPPATWFWQSPMPKRKVVQHIDRARQGSRKTPSPQATQPRLLFYSPSIPHGLAALVGPVVSLQRGSHVIIIIGRMDVHLSILTCPVVRSRSFV